MSKSDCDNLSPLVSLIFGLAMGRRGRKKGVLDHFTRGKVNGCIISEPGIHFNRLRKIVNLSSSSLAHHLRVLKDHNLIIIITDGMYKRVYPINGDLPPRIGDLSRIQRKIFTIIKENGGISQSEIARRMDTRRQVINYHVDKMLHSEYITMETRGNRSVCRINPKKLAEVQDDRQYERRRRKEIKKEIGSEIKKETEKTARKGAKKAAKKVSKKRIKKAAKKASKKAARKKRGKRPKKRGRSRSGTRGRSRKK